MPIAKVLIANRGEIACRVIATARKLGIQTVAVFSDADADARHVSLADEAVRIGPAPVNASYLRVDRLLEAAARTGADAIHPGYGFLSERADFAQAVTAAGHTFIGPPASAIAAMGLKDRAKALMAEAGVPVVPGYHGEEQGVAALLEQAQAIGFPVLIKARAGGGGKGMRRVDDPRDFADALAGAQREAQASFGDPHCLIEKLIQNPRHIEMQIFADQHGRVVHLFERDCSLQRRHQKVMEEAPAPGMTEPLRQVMGRAAVRAAEVVGYVGAGTVEFIADGSGPLSEDGFWFMEMNTRLQVEHPVTEAVTGIDLVALQFRVAEGQPLPFQQADLSHLGHAVEVRLYAEDPAAGFLPTTGDMVRLQWPAGHQRDGEGDVRGRLRVDSGIREGDTVSPHYDPMLAKLVAHADDRHSALRILADALADTTAIGVTTNRRFLQRLVEHPSVRAGAFDTGFIAAHAAVTEPDRPAAQDWAMAALAVLGAERVVGSADNPLFELENFRLWGGARREVRFEAPDGVAQTIPDDSPEEAGGGKPGLPVVVETTAGGRHRVETPAGTLELVEIAARDGVYACDGVLHHARVTPCCLADRPAVVVQRRDAEVVFYLAQPDGGGDADVGADRDRVLAPMTGIVQTVEVAPGVSVTAGQVVAVLAAMKMEHSLVAARAGRIAEVRVSPGDQVTRGDVLATLATD